MGRLYINKQKLRNRIKGELKMNIKEVTVNAEASRNYQKYCIAITAENLESEDLEILKNLAITESVKGIDQLANKVDIKPDIKVTTVAKPANNQTYTRVPAAPRIDYSKTIKNISDKQKFILQKAGYSIPQIEAMDPLEAREIIKEYWTSIGYTPDNNRSVRQYPDECYDE